MKPPRGTRTPRKAKKSDQDPVEVFCRLRPLANSDDETCCKALGINTLQLTPPENSHCARNGYIKEFQYEFKLVFNEASSQKSIFDKVAYPLVEDLLNGKNALLFVYGITSSGKTYTMNGTPQDQGILPRSLDVIFNSIQNFQAKKYVFKPDKLNNFEVQSEVDAMQERQKRDILPKLNSREIGNLKDRFEGSKARVPESSVVSGIDEDNMYSVFISYVEIYNKFVYDLLEELQYDPITGHGKPTVKELREANNHSMYVAGVREIEVKSTEEAFDVIHKGQKRRKVAHTALNTGSSRSHAILNIRLVQAPLDQIGEEVLQDNSKVCVSQLSLVDLAGSERTVRTGNAGDRLREAGNINNSLMVLRNCIEALRENQKNGGNRMVPYRESKLTHLFKNNFDGEGKVKMIVNVNPSAAEFDETLHVMKFAELTQEVQVARSERVHFDLGLTPGRRRLNQQYKATVQKLSEAKDALDAFAFNLGPSFPNLELKDPHDDMTLKTLAIFLAQREKRRLQLREELAQQQEAFRANLITMDTENTDLKSRVNDLQLKVTDQNVIITRFEKQVKNLEKSKQELSRKLMAYEHEIKGLEKEVDQKEWRLQAEKSERDRLQQDYKAKIVLGQHNYNRKIEDTKRKLLEENEARLKSKQNKLDRLADIINTDSNGSDIENFRSRTPGRIGLATSRIVPAKSEPNLSDIDGGTPTGPVTRLRPVHSRISQHSRAYTSTTPRAKKSPPPVKPKPIYNPRHRRSKSSHEVWLEHKPVGTIDTGTLLKPTMKKKRSVTKITEKDTQKASNYLLTHQNVNSDGELATNFVKGEMLPTAGGGRAVVFNDVEVLKQTSPGDRKRRSVSLRPEDFDGEWTDPEDRCRIAIEGHGNLKKAKVSVV